MSTPSTLCAAAEIALNRYLALEPSVAADCAKLDGRRIALHLQDLDWWMTIELQQRGVRVDGGTSPDGVDVTLRAPSVRLAGLALRSATGDKPSHEGINVEGDVELLQRFVDLLNRVGFDIEELLANWTGDAVAHRLGQFARQALSWGRRSADSLSYSTAEYLREETGDLARAADVEQWMDEVETLREDADRFAARLEQLTARINAGESA